MSWFKIQSIFSTVVISLLIFTVISVTAADRFGTSNRTNFNPAGTKWPWFNPPTPDPGASSQLIVRPDRRQTQERVVFNPEGARWPGFNGTTSPSETTQFASSTPSFSPSDRVAFNPETARWPWIQRPGEGQAAVLARESAKIRDVNRLRTQPTRNWR